jgi:hypothetical protein
MTLDRTLRRRTISRAVTFDVNRLGIEVQCRGVRNVTRCGVPPVAWASRSTKPAPDMAFARKWSLEMGLRKIHPALRHGLYSALSVLPGEDEAAFQKLCRHLAEEYAPSGVSELELLHDIARLIWRKQHLSTYRLAHLARAHRDELVEERMRRLSDRSSLPKDVEARVRREDQMREDAEQEVREELGLRGDLLEFTDDDVTLMHDLELHEKLDAMIARSIKQLLVVKGLKTVNGLGPSVTAREKRVAEMKPPLKLAAPAPTAMRPAPVALKK